MIYVAHKITQKFLTKLIIIALNLNGQLIALWEDLNIVDIHKQRKNLLEEISPFYFGKKNLEVVTLYDSDDQWIKIADCYMLNKEIVEILIDKYHPLTEMFDSISIYKQNSVDWFMCVIFHEKVSLMRLSKEELGQLEAKGISYSDNPPSWWYLAKKMKK